MIWVKVNKEFSKHLSFNSFQQTIKLIYDHNQTYGKKAIQKAKSKYFCAGDTIPCLHYQVLKYVLKE